MVGSKRESDVGHLCKISTPVTASPSYVLIRFQCTVQTPFRVEWTFDPDVVPWMEGETWRVGEGEGPVSGSWTDGDSL